MSPIHSLNMVEREYDVLPTDPERYYYYVERFGEECREEVVLTVKPYEGYPDRVVLYEEIEQMMSVMLKREVDDVIRSYVDALVKLDGIYNSVELVEKLKVEDLSKYLFIRHDDWLRLENYFRLHL